MTTNGRARKPAERPIGKVGTSSSAGAPAGTTPVGATTEPAARRAGASAPDEAVQLRHEIAETRQQLGETVEQLIAKADAKARTRATTAKLSQRVKSKATPVVRAGRDQLQHRAAAVSVPVREATPEPLRHAAAKGARTVKQRRVPLAVAPGVPVAGCLVIRRWGGR